MVDEQLSESRPTSLVGSMARDISRWRNLQRSKIDLRFSRTVKTT